MHIVDLPSFPSAPAAAFVIGGGATTKSAIFALSTLKVSPIYVLNRDAAEVDDLKQQYPDIDLVYLTSDEQAQQAIATGPPIVVSVGVIPSFAPKTEAEKAVYSIAKILFGTASTYTPPQTEPKTGSYIPFPKKPIILEMNYKSVRQSSA